MPQTDQNWSPKADAQLLAQLRAQGPMNRARAEEIMQRFGLDALVLGEPLNVFHATGYWPQMANTKTGQPPTTLVVVPRDARRPLGLITSHFLYYYTFADAGLTQPFETFLFMVAADSGESRPLEVMPDQFPDRRAAPLTGTEQRRLDAASAAWARGADSEAGAALARALRDLGMWNGRIAYDHPVIAAVCERRDRPGEQVEADNVMRWIRLVKSPVEIAMMRRASEANVAAVEAVARQVRSGATLSELRRLYDMEIAARGSRPVFLTLDRVSSELCDDPIVEGQSLFVDGVSHRYRYHGDYARTVFVGEPRGSARKAAEAAAFGWNAVRELLRPGLRYSEIVAAGAEALRKSDHVHTVGFGPHSVGLMHTDEPGLELGGFMGKQDLILEPNMILSVDCPVLDTGYGGSVHLEDLMLITENGAEPIHPIGEMTVTV